MRQQAPNKWGILFSVIFGIFMVILDATVVNVAFPTLRREFGVGVNESQWVISVYTMALGIATPLAGFLADRFGIKRIYITGLALFVLGSILCGVVPAPTVEIFGQSINGIWVLSAARAVQGFGGGLALPLGTAILFSAFPAEEQGLALGVFGIALVLAPALGPIVGGWLVDHDLWRWIFFINLPIGLLGIAMASYFLIERKNERKVPLDILGFITSAIGFGTVLFAASIASNEGLSSAKVLVFFAIGFIFLILFALVELFIAREPLLNLRLFERRVFTIATIVGWVSVIALFGAEFLMPLYLQTLRGKTAFESGLILLPLAIASGIVAPFAGRLFDKVGARPILAVGFFILMINTWQLAQIKADTAITWIMFLLAIRGIALGLTVQTTLVAALSVVPGRQVACASALSNSTRQVVQSIGIAVLATLLTSTLSQQVKDFQSQYQNATTSGQNSAIASIFTGKGLCEPVTAPPPNVPGSEIITQILKVRDQACQESVQGFERAYTATFFAALLALLISLFLPGWPGKLVSRRAADEEESGESQSSASTAAA